MDTSSEPLTLTNFSDSVHIAGELLTGSVDLNVALAHAQKIDTVLVKLRGFQQTWAMAGEINYIQRIPLIKMDQTLWASNNANSDAESHTIRLPFSFQLPKDLPPSFKHVGVGYSGEITYSIQIVGQRAGLLQRNRRVGRVFPLMPAVGIQGVCAKVDLLAGWKGTWKTITSDSKIRRGLWGQQSKIEVEFKIPELETFPIGVSIPFRLHIVTTTGLMERSELDKQLSEGKDVFPPPPTTPSSIHIQLDKVVTVKAYKVPYNNMRVRGKGVASDDQTMYTFVQEDPEWVPSLTSPQKGDTSGVWRRSVRLESSFILSGSPSFKTATIYCSYILHICVPFPGMRNKFKYDLPIILDSGMACTEPSSGRAPPYSSPVLSSVLDLPPAYWEGEDHDWDDDKKHP